MGNKTHISIVIPVYGCKTTLIELCISLNNVLASIGKSGEIILVNDASPDQSWDTITEICSKFLNVKGINLSRNFGQHFAITAGLENSLGDWIVVMDCDLQDEPEEVFNLYKKAQEGYDIVFAQRIKRKDFFLKIFISKIFYSILAFFTDTKQDYTIGNFGIYSKKAIDNVLKMRDNFRFFPTMIKWVGFKSTAISVKHSERRTGKSSYSFRKLINLGIDTILTFSDKPLRLTVKFGLIIVLFSIIFTLYNLYLYFSGQILAIGWTSIIISIWFLAGMIILILGIVGLYVGKTFDSIKNRPYYIIKDRINFDE